MKTSCRHSNTWPGLVLRARAQEAPGPVTSAALSNSPRCSCFSDSQVGHVRAAEELRATLLYAPSSKDSPKARQSASPRGSRTTSHRETGLRKQRPGSSRTSFPPSQPEAKAAAAPSRTQQRASSTASKAAASAMAAVQKGDRPYYMGAAGWASRSQKVRLAGWGVSGRLAWASTRRLLSSCSSVYRSLGAAGTRRFGNARPLAGVISRPHVCDQTLHGVVWSLAICSEGGGAAFRTAAW